MKNLMTWWYKLTFKLLLKRERLIDLTSTTIAWMIVLPIKVAIKIIEWLIDLCQWFQEPENRFKFKSIVAVTFFLIYNVWSMATNVKSMQDWKWWQVYISFSCYIGLAFYMGYLISAKFIAIRIAKQRPKCVGKTYTVIIEDGFIAKSFGKMHAN